MEIGIKVARRDDRRMLRGMKDREKKHDRWMTGTLEGREILVETGEGMVKAQ